MTKSLKLYKSYILPCLALIILIDNSAIFQFYPIFGMRLTGMLLTALFCVVYWSSIKKELAYFSPIIYWGILMGYHIVNLYAKNLYAIEEQMDFTTAAICEMCIMLLISYLYKKNKQALFVLLIASLYFFLYIAYLYCEIDERSDRLDGFIGSTQLGQMAGITCMIIALYIVLLKKNIVYYILFIFPIFIGLLTQSRNMLFPLGFAFLILIYPHLQKKRMIYIIGYITLGIICYSYLLTTDLFTRALDSKVEGYWKTNTILDSVLGDRALYYVMGFANWLENPLTGIGLYNFMDYNRFWYPLHGEFITHFAEGGLIGIVLYLVFLHKFMKPMLKNWRFSNINQNIMIMSLLCILILGFTTREYPFIFFFVVYGILLGYINETISKTVK